ncbi:MAG: right-handed parallel beta-helix repeat-containing protein [Chloroflexota bacterium]|nr:right-handed parallel beta-helix repeat-containing protein [Chloroflexota bacterium]
MLLALLSVLLFTTGAAFLVSEPSSPAYAAAATAPECSSSDLASLQSQIDAYLANASTAPLVVTAKSCVYRGTLNIKHTSGPAKSLTLAGTGTGTYGTGGSEIRGSDIWTGQSAWTLKQSGRGNGGRTWVSNSVVPLTNTNGANTDGRCAQPQCHYPEQVYVTNQSGTTKKYQLVLSGNPAVGQFAVDAQRHIILNGNEDPVNNRVEVTTRTNWIVGTIQDADSLVIQGFSMRHAGDDALNGAVYIQGKSVTIQNNTMAYAHGENVTILTNNKLTNNDLGFADDFGLHSPDGSNMVVSGNLIHDNNLNDTYNPNWGSGGDKNTVGSGTQIYSNEVFNNHGPGLWCDSNCQNVKYFDNRIHHNTHAGILFEISDGAEIYNNKIWNNGKVSGQSWFGWGAGIVISSSAHANVHDNILAWNGSGIEVVDQNRPDKPAAGTSGNVIQRNSIFSCATPSSNYNTTPSSMVLSFDISTAAGNSGSANSFWYASTDPEGQQLRFSWLQQYYATLASFNPTPGGGNNSTYLTDASLTTLLAANNMPTSCSF